MTEDWRDRATTFNKQSLAGTDYVYCWVVGTHLKGRLVPAGDDRVRADGTEELIALRYEQKRLALRAFDIQVRVRVYREHHEPRNEVAARTPLPRKNCVQYSSRY